MSVTAIPSNELTPKHKPPSHGEPKRDAIGSIVDEISVDLNQQIKTLKEGLDQIGQRALQSAANAKGALNDHVGICARLAEEVERTRTVIADICKKMEG